MDDQDGRELIEAVERAWNRRDAEGYAALFAETAALRDMALTEALEGRAAIRVSTQAYMEALPDLHTWTERLTTDGVRVVQEWVMTGRHDGELMGVPPTGRRVRARGCTVFALDGDGLIADAAHYWSILAVMEQLGLLNPPVPGLDSGG